MQPRWLDSNRDYSQVQKRMSIPGRLASMLSGILPTYQVERNWPGDQTALFGAEGVTGRFVPATGHLAVSLHNASDALPREEQLELLVWRMNAELFTQVNLLASPNSIHMFTPLGNYNPNQIPSPIPQFFPWFQPVAPGELGHLSRAGHLDAGVNPTLLVVIVNGNPTTVLGPTMQNRGMVSFGAIVSAEQKEYGLSGTDMPPVIVRPGQKLTFQSVNQFLVGAELELRGNFWWSERKYVVGL